MALNRSPLKLAKLLDYVLSRRPDEFGLVTDNEGFVKIKDLLKALSEEAGLGYVRRAHLNEIMLCVPDHGLEITDTRIRSKLHERLPQPVYAQDPPKLLYVCVRRKAYPHVGDKGIQPAGHDRIILSSRIDMAERLGRRIDHSAVLLTVQVQACMDSGVVFFQSGETLFLADFIPSGGFTGPPLPKEKPAPAKPAESESRLPRTPPGSYTIDLEEKFAERVPRSKRMAPEEAWKKGGKQTKKDKRKRERPPWRR